MESTSSTKTIIRADKGWVPLQLGELWAYRELLYFLTWRDVKVRYKQTILGATWAVLQPFTTMVVFSIFLGGLAKVPSDGLPYPLFTFCALLPWQLFAHAMSEAGNSVVGSQNLITKVYFPRLVIPFAPVLAALVDFVIAFVILLLMMVWYGIHLTAAALVLPLLILFAVCVALAVGLWLSALNVKYRDVRYTIPFLTQIWMFLTPVAYPASMIPEKWKTIYGLNPMVGVVEVFRWALLGSPPTSLSMLGLSFVVVLLMLIGGLYYFKRMERQFADVV